MTGARNQIQSIIIRDSLYVWDVLVIHVELVHIPIGVFRYIMDFAGNRLCGISHIGGACIQAVVIRLLSFLGNDLYPLFPYSLLEYKPLVFLSVQ